MMRDRVLALDLATRTGWALFDLEGGLLGWGDFYCAPTKAMGRWKRFRRGLTDVCPTAIAERLAAVALERPWAGRGKQGGNREGGRQARAGSVSWGLVAHAEHWAELRGVHRDDVHK